MGTRVGRQLTQHEANCALVSLTGSQATRSPQYDKAYSKMPSKPTHPANRDIRFSPLASYPSISQSSQRRPAPSPIRRD